MADSADVWQQIRDRLERMHQARSASAEPAALAARLSNRAQLLRGRLEKSAAAGPQLGLLAFHKGSERYGVPIDNVLEIQALDQFSPVPKTPAFIPGVVLWRGAILTLLDLGLLFEVPQSGIADVHVALVVEGAGKRVAIVATNVEEIHSVPLEQIKPAPHLPGKLPPEWVIGIHDENRIIVRVEQILEDARLTQWRT
jgi:purine-binding chemotaxis protein CheW